MYTGWFVINRDKNLVTMKKNKGKKSEKADRSNKANSEQQSRSKKICKSREIRGSMHEGNT